MYTEIFDNKKGRNECSILLYRISGTQKYSVLCDNLKPSDVRNLYFKLMKELQPKKRITVSIDFIRSLELDVQKKMILDWIKIIPKKNDTQKIISRYKLLERDLVRWEQLSVIKKKIIDIMENFIDGMDQFLRADPSILTQELRIILINTRVVERDILTSDNELQVYGLTNAYVANSESYFSLNRAVRLFFQAYILNLKSISNIETIKSQTITALTVFVAAVNKVINSITNINSRQMLRLESTSLLSESGLLITRIPSAKTRNALFVLINEYEVFIGVETSSNSDIQKLIVGIRNSMASFQKTLNIATDDVLINFKESVERWTNNEIDIISKILIEKNILTDNLIKYFQFYDLKKILGIEFPLLDFVKRTTYDNLAGSIGFFNQFAVNKDPLLFKDFLDTTDRRKFSIRTYIIPIKIGTSLDNVYKDNLKKIKTNRTNDLRRVYVKDFMTVFNRSKPTTKDLIVKDVYGMNITINEDTKDIINKSLKQLNKKPFETKRIQTKLKGVNVLTFSF